MKGDQEAITLEAVSPKRCSLNEGLLMVPKTAGCIITTNKHKRTSSNGTTGDEACTTDDEEIYIDEPDIAIKNDVTRKLFKNHDPGAFGSFSDIATITDKVRHLSVMHRNSSDSSVYSEKCPEELDEISSYELKDDSDSKSGSSSADPADWSSTMVKEQAFLRLQHELKEANHELKVRDQELNRLSRIRQDVESELEDLTASLFQVGNSFSVYAHFGNLKTSWLQILVHFLYLFVPAPLS